MGDLPGLGIALKTWSGDSPRDTLRYHDACLDVAADLGADVVLMAGHHGREAGLQNIPAIARLVPRAGSVPLAPLFLAPTWPPRVLVEQIVTLAQIARTEGGRILAVVASGAGGEPVVRIPDNPEADRGVGTDLTLAALREASIETWVAGERGRGLTRALDGDGWIANAVYGADELTEQMAVVSSAPVRAVRRDIVLRTDPAEAARVVDGLLSDGYRSKMRPHHVVQGDVPSCIEQLRDLARLGFTHVLLRPMSDDLDEAVTTLSTILEAARTEA